MRKRKKEIDLVEYHEIVENILGHDEFLRRREFPHHGKESVYDHSLRVSKLSYRIAKRLNLDYKGAAIAGLLHDLYDKPWQDDKEKRKFFKQHGFVHAKEALENARIHFSEHLDAGVENAIVRHMFPLNIKPPVKAIGWVVTISDKIISLSVLKDVKNLPKYVGIKKKKKNRDL